MLVWVCEEEEEEEEEVFLNQVVPLEVRVENAFPTSSTIFRLILLLPLFGVTNLPFSDFLIASNSFLLSFSIFLLN